MEQKKFLFVSSGGQTADTAWKIVQEGHQVKMWIEMKSERDVGDGFVEKVPKWQTEVDWADIIIFDNTLGFGAIAEKLRKKGKHVIGGTSYTDKLEDDRGFGQEELKKHGINVISHQNFTSFPDAITYVRENPGRYVVKPAGEIGSVNKSLLFVGEEEDGKDVLQVLADYERALSSKNISFQLQKRIVGIEVAVGAYFNGQQFLTPINVNFENKKLFPGNIGPSTGEMGTHMYWAEPNKLFNQTLKKFEARLAQENYVGYIDLNCIVNGNGIYPLEFTARFGFPTLYIHQEGITMPISEFFYKMACGEQFTIKTKQGFQVGVYVVVPPFPFSDKETFNTTSKNALIFFKKGREGAHIVDLKQINNEWIVTGTTGAALVVCGTGNTMQEAQKQAYTRIKNIIIPHMYYRDDIGNRWQEDHDKMHTWGYLR